MDLIFEPLQPWEQPPSVLAGSGAALHKTVSHLVHYIRSSFSPPLPFAGHPTGIRQTQLPPPPEQTKERGSSDKSEERAEQPRFHFRKMMSRRGWTTRSSDSSVESTTKSSNADPQSMKEAADIVSSEMVLPVVHDDSAHDPDDKC